ncbi:MAG: FAD-binding protein [Planctomycetes bacterium]|nr:FAD-binding protein [Planctomycetota bacterium]
MVERQSADVVIVGGGGAALRAALAARDAGASVLILTKGELGKAGVTALACSDRMAFHATLEHTEPGGPDAWRYHAEDIYRIGGRVSDADLARVLAQGAAEAFHYLDHLGVPFAKDEAGRADQFVTDGSKYARACYTGPHTANHIHDALRNEVRRRGLPLLENVMAVDVALDASGRAAGVRLADGRLVRAGAVILATGGAGLAYEVNVFPEGMTGDGHAMAFRAGADLVNLEFIQIGLSSVKTKLACSGSLMRAWPRLVTGEDREFLADYFPAGTPPEDIYAVLFRKGASWPVSYEEPSHVIDVAVFSEMQKGRTVWMDFSRNPAGLDLSRIDPALWAKYPNVARLRLTESPLADSPLERLKAINLPSVAWLAERGIDLAAGDRIELAPACQHFQGGIKIDTRAATTVPGLFACGEAAGGQHGANRPGGNALMDSQVMGRIAGEQAAALARTAPPGEPAGAAVEPAPRGQAVDVREVRRRIQHLMTMYASIKRTAQGVKAGLAELRGLRARPWDTADAGDAFLAETQSIALVAEMVLTACGARPESRGPHLWFNAPDAITPLPRKDPEWQKCNVLRPDDDGAITIETRRPVEPDWELAQKIDA